MKYMHIIDKTIQQIVIQKDSLDPDPAADLAQIDVARLLQKMAVDGDRLRESEERLKKARERYKRLEKELEMVKGSNSAVSVS
jgi:predicted ATP-grasp superfamily ATP-dependent carboligase